MTVEDVLNAWANGKPARAATTSTDGTELYSYAHRIGTRLSGELVAFACKASRTTAGHVAQAARRAAIVIPCPCGGTALTTTQQAADVVMGDR